MAKWRGSIATAWTADGKALLYCLPGSDGGSDFWLAAAEGGQSRKLHSVKEEVVRIAAHSNGRDIAISTRDNSGGRFWVIENPFGDRRK
jgi:hypothetical protein